MSWSVSFKKPVRKAEALNVLADLSVDSAYLNSLESNVSTSVGLQLERAKSAALVLLDTVPGPYLTVSLSGHANAAGEQKKEGYANDCINVQVSQVCEEDLKYYNQ